MKTKKFIRSGPHLPVNNSRATLEYYRDVLGFMMNGLKAIKMVVYAGKNYSYFLLKTQISLGLLIMKNIDCLYCGLCIILTRFLQNSKKEILKSPMI